MTHDFNPHPPNPPLDDPALRRLDAELHRTAPVRTPAGLNNRLFEATAHRLASPAVVGRIGPSARQWLGWACAAAAAALLVSGGLLLRPTPEPAHVAVAPSPSMVQTQAEQLWADNTFEGPLDVQITLLGQRIEAMTLALAEPDFSRQPPVDADLLAAEMLELENEWSIGERF